MTDLRTAAQQALEALEWLKQRGLFGDFHGVTDALKAALAQEKPKSVGKVPPRKFPEDNDE